MLAKRIIPCLDVKNGKVVKGVKFRNHKIVGEILPLILRYLKEDADEIVFYDITASSKKYLVNQHWIKNIAEIITIPFCVAGGINSIDDARKILSLGADKISINSPAISNPTLINKISNTFGVQCVVIGIDSWFNNQTKCYEVYQYTGSDKTIKKTKLTTESWVKEVQDRGAGEIVINTMNQDGVNNGYDIEQLKKIRDLCKIPLIASGGAGTKNHFYDLFKKTNVDGALAASVFHKQIINIQNLKKFLKKKGIEIRLCH